MHGKPLRGDFVGVAKVGNEKGLSQTELQICPFGDCDDSKELDP